MVHRVVCVIIVVVCRVEVMVVCVVGVELVQVGDNKIEREGGREVAEVEEGLIGRGVVEGEVGEEEGLVGMGGNGVERGEVGKTVVQWHPWPVFGESHTLFLVEFIFHVKK